MHWYPTKELSRQCSLSLTVVSYDLVVSHIELGLTVLHLAFQLKLSFNQVDNNTNKCTMHFEFFLGGARKL